MYNSFASLNTSLEGKFCFSENQPVYIITLCDKLTCAKYKYTRKQQNKCLLLSNSHDIGPFYEFIAHQVLAEALEEQMEVSLAPFSLDPMTISLTKVYKS